MTEYDTVPAPVAARIEHGTDDFAALRATLARAQAEGAPVTVVFAPTTVTHHHTAPGTGMPGYAPARQGGPGHRGIDVDLTGYGAVYTLPPDPGPLPAVPERHEWAPLVMVATAWSGIGSVFVTILTGSPFAIAYTFLALAVNGIAFAVEYRNGQGVR